MIEDSVQILSISTQNMKYCWELFKIKYIFLGLRQPREHFKRFFTCSHIAGENVEMAHEELCTLELIF